MPVCMYVRSDITFACIHCIHAKLVSHTQLNARYLAYYKNLYCMLKALNRNYLEVLSIPFSKKTNIDIIETYYRLLGPRKPTKLIICSRNNFDIILFNH